MDVNKDMGTRGASCRYCRKKATVYRPDAGVYVCKQCFFKEIARNIQRAVTRDRLFTPNDLVVVGFSGGKDSMLLLEHCVKIQEKRHIARPPLALIVDEGIRGHREEGIRIAKTFCESRGVQFKILSFQSAFGATLDEIVEKSAKIGRRYSACTYCGILRRYLLNRGALLLGADKLATGHNLDDEVQTLLLNFLRADLTRVTNFKPLLAANHPKFVTRIKPLRTIPERDVRLYCKLKKYQFLETPCPYSRADPILRAKVLHFLQEVDTRSKEIKYNLMKLGNELRELLKAPGTMPRSCELCGFPTNSSRQTCKTCEIIQLLGLSFPDEYLAQPQ